MYERLSSQFWHYYDKACMLASQNPEWEILNLRRMYAIDQAGVSPELEELIVYSLDEQYFLILVAIFEIMRTDV